MFLSIHRRKGEKPFPWMNWPWCNLIGLKLFGGGYSGLEYDYRGLVHVYQELKDVPKVAEYMNILSNWKLSRDILSLKEETFLDLYKPACSVEEIHAQFASLN